MIPVSQRQYDTTNTDSHTRPRSHTGSSMYAYVCMEATCVQLDLEILRIYPVEEFDNINNNDDSGNQTTGDSDDISDTETDTPTAGESDDITSTNKPGTSMAIITPPT